MIVKGKDVLFTIGGRPVACARTASLTTTADIGETSTLGTGKWKTFKGLKMSFSLSAAGLVSFDMNYSLAELRDSQQELHGWDFAFFGTDANGEEERYSGSFIITNISTSNTYNANFEYSLDGQGTGPLTLEYTIAVSTLAIDSQSNSATNTYFFYLSGAPFAGDKVHFEYDISLTAGGAHTHFVIEYTALAGDTAEDMIDALLPLAFANFPGHAVKLSAGGLFGLEVSGIDFAHGIATVIHI